MKSRGLEPVTCRVYGPLHETVIFSKPLNKLVTSIIRSLLADVNTFFCSDEIPEKGQYKKGPSHQNTCKKIASCSVVQSVG